MRGLLFIAGSILCIAIGIVAGSLPLAAQPPAVAFHLPWQPDYASAIATAQTEHRHLVVLLATDNNEPCRILEEQRLTDPLIRESLADMVWVRVVDDAERERELETSEHPTLAFVNPLTGGVLHRVTGDKTVELLAREIVHARRAIGLALPPALEAVAGRMFAFDGERAEALLQAGDAEGLQALLAPAANDDSRQANYLVAQVTLPAELVPDDIRFLAGTDCLEGVDTSPEFLDDPLVAARPADLAATCAEYPLPESRLVLVPFERAQSADRRVRITAPGCLLTTDTIRFEPPAPATAVVVRRYDVRPLADAEAARLSGRVLTPDGGPAAAAIVRIDDWYDHAPGDAAAPLPAVVRTDTDGRFTFPRVSPGRWLVRAEFPGGEREQFVDLEAGGHASCDLTLSAVTTVGLRWVLQTDEQSQDLAGPGVQSGEAYTSVASSRIALGRGMRVRTSDYSDIMMAQTPLEDDSLPEESRLALTALPAGTPVWYLFDCAYTEDFLPLSGLHREDRPFDTIRVIRDGEPLPDQDWSIIGPILPQAVITAREQGNYFQFARGEPVRQGDVFTLRSATGNRFAKLEVTSVTIVTPASQ